MVSECVDEKLYLSSHFFEVVLNHLPKSVKTVSFLCHPALHLSSKPDELLSFPHNMGWIQNKSYISKNISYPNASCLTLAQDPLVFTRIVCMRLVYKCKNEIESLLKRDLKRSRYSQEIAQIWSGKCVFFNYKLSFCFMYLIGWWGPLRYTYFTTKSCLLIKCYLTIVCPKLQCWVLGPSQPSFWIYLILFSTLLDCNWSILQW